MARFNLKDSINDPKRIRYLDNNCEELHLTKSFSYKDLEKILKRCKNLKLITLSKSTKDRTSKESKKLIKSYKVSIYTKKEQGRPIDISIEKLQKVIEMHRDYSYRDLEKKLNIPKSTLHYLIRKAKKKKLKSGKKIIYLK